MKCNLRSVQNLCKAPTQIFKNAGTMAYNSVALFLKVQRNYIFWLNLSLPLIQEGKPGSMGASWHQKLQGKEVTGVAGF